MPESACLRIYRCLLAYLQEGVSVRPSVRPSVRLSRVIFSRVLGASCAVYPALFFFCSTSSSLMHNTLSSFCFISLWELKPLAQMWRTDKKMTHAKFQVNWLSLDKRGEGGRFLDHFYDFRHFPAFFRQLSYRTKIYYLTRYHTSAP